MASDRKLHLVRSKSHHQPTTTVEKDTLCATSHLQGGGGKIGRVSSMNEEVTVEVGVDKWSATLITQDQCHAESSPQLCRHDSCSALTSCLMAPPGYGGSSRELYHMGGPGMNVGSIDNMSTTCNIGLLRSMSARTIDSLPAIESSASGESGSAKMLLQLPGGGVGDIANMAARSTSCPSMAHPICRPLHITDGSISTKPPNTGGSAGTNSKSAFPFAREVDLDGEIITDLPVQFNMATGGDTFPDMIPALNIEPPVPPHVHIMLPTGSTNSAMPVFKGAANANRSAPIPRRVPQSFEITKPFLNIGELPGAIANKVIQGGGGASGGGRIGGGRVSIEANEKCMRWLNTLSLTTDTNIT